MSKLWMKLHSGTRIRTQAYWDQYGDCDICKANPRMPCVSMTTQKAGRYTPDANKHAHASRPRLGAKKRPARGSVGGYQGRHRG